MIRNGRIVADALGSGSLTHRELLMLLRQEGVRETGEVEFAFFEPSGKLSLFRSAKGRGGEATIPAAARGPSQPA